MNEVTAKSTTQKVSVSDASETPPLTLKGRAISACNAMAVGFMAMFSFKKVLYVFGAVAIGGSLPVWALASMIASGVLITVITFSMYPDDPWEGLKENLQKKLDDSSWFAHINGHLGGVIKAFMAFAGVWVIASGLLGAGAFAMLPVMIAIGIVGGIAGLAQYFVETAALIPESAHLFSLKPLRKIAPTHNKKQLLLTSIKWPLVILHALGQGLGFFACLLMFGSISSAMLPVVLAIGGIAALIIGPSTGRYYGEPFFGLGATLYLQQAKCSENKGNTAGRLIEINATRSCEIALESAGIDPKDIRNECGGLSQVVDYKQKNEQLARAFGYQVRWKDERPSSPYKFVAQALGYVIGFVGAGFKGALAFAGTVVFFSLCLSGALTALLVSPPTYVLAISLVVGIATWIVQSARACPNTAKMLGETWDQKCYSHSVDRGSRGSQPVKTWEVTHWFRPLFTTKPTTPPPSPMHTPADKDDQGRRSGVVTLADYC